MFEGWDDPVEECIASTPEDLSSGIPVSGRPELLEPEGLGFYQGVA